MLWALAGFVDLPGPRQKAAAVVKVDAPEERSPSMTALIAQLASSRKSLPPEIQQLVERELEQALYKLVSLQGQARQVLHTVGRAREQFLADWAQYLTDVCALIETQFRLKSEHLQQLDAPEETIAAESGDIASATAATASSEAPIDLISEIDSKEDSSRKAMSEKVRPQK